LKAQRFPAKVLVDQKDVEWKNRSHFFGIAAQQMRRILVDYARGHQAKRGSSAARITLNEAMVVSKGNPWGILIVDETLDRLAAFDPRQAKIVDLLIFGGLTVEEVAEVLGISPATVKREWTFARTWLTLEMKRHLH
jgi:RNA polymerase sigma-70 factor, ECF subfamily